MSNRRRKFFYWSIRLLALLISCSFPIWAICERYPIWTVTYGAVRWIGAGGILILIVLLIVFRKAVFGFIKDKLKVRNAPPIVVWIVMLITSYVLLYIADFMRDLTSVFWMGLIGCAIGTFLTFIAESKFGFPKKEQKENNNE